MAKRRRKIDGTKIPEILEKHKCWIHKRWTPDVYCYVTPSGMKGAVILERETEIVEYLELEEGKTKEVVGKYRSLQEFDQAWEQA